MKVYIMSLCSILTLVSALAQKRVIDIAACNNFERLEEVNGNSCLLSFDGKYVIFKSFTEKEGTITVLRNLELSTERKFLGTYNESAFSENKMFAFQLPGDSLVIFDAEKDTYIYILDVKWYFVNKSETVNIIGYFTERDGKKWLTIWDLKKGKRREFQNVDAGMYWFNREGTALLVKSANGLMYIDLNGLKDFSVTSSINTESAAFSSDGDEIAYITRETKGFKLRYFNVKSMVADILVSDSSDYLRNGWQLRSEGLSFGNNAGNIFFKISRANSYYDRKQDSVISQDVNVWSYLDLSLQERQLPGLQKRPAFTTMINVRSRKIYQLESDELSLEPVGSAGDFYVLTSRINEDEFYWNKQKKQLFLFSAINGDKTLIMEAQHPGFMFIGISPDSKFLVWFNGADGNYYSYNIADGRISNMSKFADGSLSTLNQRGVAAKSINKTYPYATQHWIDNGKSVIVNGKNDIWQLDPLGVKEPINITNGYGDSNNIRFRMVDANGIPVKFNDREYLVWAFDNRSKQNGFWTIRLGTPLVPKKLVMSDDAYYFSPEAPIVSANDAEDPRRFIPVKAVNNKLFVVRKMNCSEAPNLYYTVDFKKVIPITNIKTDKKYVWSFTKLVTWRLEDGKEAEGILHIPDNFDSTSKYPVIFNYYERRSECLNVFRTPELSGHNINIPWYVSRGYLVFEPDFYYKRGETAKSVIRSVKSALAELQKISYVDQSRMGLQGQSHGGYETNILATGTNLFVAACEMAGYTNIISEYGSIRPGGFNNQMAADVDQRNLGVFPWDHPEIFIENSPVFRVSQITTPLLMVHNKEDVAVSFSQAIELYLSMRRLGKKVWMLQYDGEGHTIDKYANKLDFTMRMQQFFDHYLKGDPMPIWMSRGIPASLKGVVSGLQYETSLLGRTR